ncbi:hypothetical protein GG804_28895 [Sphingomonas histidinilytica]|nr:MULTISPECIES: hypothetical protein [Sphingomonadaceae]MBO9380781.1 hypothetical protein [Rhizorhabdus histidinilytica]QXF14275.1 hypothetical protein HBA51_18400 [Sphingopyxis terrae subsp. terrae]WRD78513.1 hypothetical protein QQ987_18645 [Sphingobium baderi]
MSERLSNHWLPEPMCIGAFDLPGEREAGQAGAMNDIDMEEDSDQMA